LVVFHLALAWSRGRPFDSVSCHRSDSSTRHSRCKAQDDRGALEVPGTNGKKLAIW
jgi:hypothetical protein